MVVSHWCKLFEGLEASPQDFYRSVEAALAARQVPALQTSRVHWHEGGPLSAKREYLRLTRERLVFDICAAPFGSGFFVSSRLVEEPSKVSILAVCAILFGLLIVLALFILLFGWFWGFFIMLICLAAGTWFLRNIVSHGLTDLDATLLRIPVLGPIYERFFRAITYYRIDTTLMFQQAVHGAVMEAIDELVNLKGINPLSAEERKPILAELFRR